VKTFDEQVKEYRNTASSISLLSSNTDSYFSEVYGISGSGGEEPFMDIYINGKIYTGEYLTNSKVGEGNKFINRYPLFLFIDQQRVGDTTILRSLDLNVIPPDQRGQVLARIFNQFFQLIKENQYNLPNSQQPLRLPLSSLGTLLGGTGYSYALTGFKKTYLRGIKVVDYKDWCKIPYLSESMIQGLPINSIYSDYRSKLNP
jgi:hypothetical protein